MPFAAIWMDLKIVTLSEVSHTEKDKYHMTSLLCEIFKKNKIQMNLFDPSLLQGPLSLPVFQFSFPNI